MVKIGVLAKSWRCEVKLKIINKDIIFNCNYFSIELLFNVNNTVRWSHFSTGKHHYFYIRKSIFILHFK